MIMNWENGFQANTEYTVDDVVDEGYPTKGESIVRVPRTGGPNTPAFLLTGEPARPGAEPRDELARMLTADTSILPRNNESHLGRTDGLRHRRARR